MQQSLRSRVQSLRRPFPQVSLCALIAQISQIREGGLTPYIRAYTDTGERREARVRKREKTTDISEQKEAQERKREKKVEAQTQTRAQTIQQQLRRQRRHSARRQL